MDSLVEMVKCSSCEGPLPKEKKPETTHIFENTKGIVVGRYHAHCCPRCNYSHKP